MFFLLTKFKNHYVTTRYSDNMTTTCRLKYKNPRTTRAKHHSSLAVTMMTTSTPYSGPPLQPLPSPAVVTIPSASHNSFGGESGKGLAGKKASAHQNFSLCANDAVSSLSHSASPFQVELGNIYPPEQPSGLSNVHNIRDIHPFIKDNEAIFSKSAGIKKNIPFYRGKGWRDITLAQLKKCVSIKERPISVGGGI